MWEREEVVKGRKRENRKKSEQIKEVGEKMKISFWLISVAKL